MRTLLSILFVAFIFTVLSIWSFYYLSNSSEEVLKSMDGLETNITAGNWDKAREQIERAYLKWGKTKKRWAMIIDHQEIDNIELTLVRLRNLSKAEDDAGTMAELATLIRLLQHIPEKEAVTLHNLL